MLAFCCKRFEWWCYEEEQPSALRQFFSFCLVRPAGRLRSVIWFDSKQRLSGWARLKYYPQMHTFTWTVMWGGGFKHTATDLRGSICHTDCVLRYYCRCMNSRFKNSRVRWRGLKSTWYWALNELDMMKCKKQRLEYVTNFIMGFSLRK